MVKPPDVEQMERDTQERIDCENWKESDTSEPFFKVIWGNLSKTAREMLSYEPILPAVFDKVQDASCFVVKKCVPHTLEIEKLLS